MVEVKISYEGNLRCSATHGPSSARIETDAPVDNHGLGQAFSPTDLAATSLGVCLMTVMGIAADARGVDLAGATVRVEKHMAPTPPRRIGKIVLDVTLPIPADHPHAAALERIGRSCPVALSLHPEIEQVVTFRYGNH